MLVHIYGVPTWRPENSVNIWNLLWLSGRLIFCTYQTSIYISHFPNALTSKKATNHEIAALCRAPHNSEIQNALTTKQSTLLSCKIVNRYKYTFSYA